MPVVRLSHLPNKDEEENACAGRKYNHECNCIKQVPDRKILIVCFHLALVPGVLNLSPALARVVAEGRDVAGKALRSRGLPG
jgi:hypothetical protein